MKANIILDNIPRGIDNAVGVKELAARCDIDERVVRSTISRYRRQGVIICSNTDSSEGRTGYYYPETAEELEKYVVIETARIRTHAAAVAPAKARLQKIKGADIP